MSDKIQAVRGRQITVGRLVLVFPADIPVTDAEVVDREELVARIENALEPYRAVVKFGDQIVKALREDVTRCFAKRQIGDEEQLTLFKVGEMAPSGDLELRAKMARACLDYYGWEVDVNRMATEGAANEEIMKFLGEKLPSQQETRSFGEGFIRVSSVPAPSVIYVSDLNETPRDRVQLSGADLTQAFRKAFAIGHSPNRRRRPA